MANEVVMGKDGFLRITLSGDLDRGNIEMLRQDYSPFLEASTPEIPLNNVLFAHNAGKMSSAARRYFTDLNLDPKYGFLAIVNPPRRVRVLAKFILKATGRKNIAFFEDEKKAIEWLKEKSKLSAR